MRPVLRLRQCWRTSKPDRVEDTVILYPTLNLTNGVTTMHDTVYIIVTVKEFMFVGVYATRERAEYMIRNSGMPENTYQVIAQTPVWDK